MDTFFSIAEAWLKDVRRTRRPKTAQSYEIAVAKLVECIPAARERFITRADLIKFRDWRTDTTSVSSANRDLKALKAALSWIWLNELGHPPVNLKRLLLPPPPRKDETLTSEEIERVMKASEFDVPVRIVLRICYGTGFRLGEVLNLIWSDVDFDEGEISITPKPWWQPKTDAAIRTVYATELTEWLGEYRKTLRHAGVRDRICQQDEKSGKPWGHRIHERLRRVYERAGISGKKPTHSLRHTMASDLVQSGAPIHVAQRHLGHASASVTLAVYAHAKRDGLRQAGAALEEYRRGRQAGD